MNTDPRAVVAVRSALRRVEAAAPEFLLIPQPSADQLLLEARLMAALAGGP
ncbi:hypothetical protein [Streptomyces humidus]|uniref:hypothetical protein n=1 Tax=Streptomyces humidus TaxID=52259 RepID=UPI0033215521